MAAVSTAQDDHHNHDQEADHHHEHKHEHEHGHDHDHAPGVWGWLQENVPFLHSHSHAEVNIDSALEGSERGIWALKVSLLGLGLTAVFQLIIAVVSGSVGLLADTIHNFADALTAGRADAALAASLFHYKELTIGQVKDYLAGQGVAVRRDRGDGHA